MTKDDERLLYVTNLLSETLPEEFMTQDKLESLGLSSGHDYMLLQVLLSNGFKAQISALDSDSTHDWKQDFHEKITSCLTSGSKCHVEVVSLLNLQPFTRTIILKTDLNSDHANLYASLSRRFRRMNGLLYENYHEQVIGCFGSVVSSFFDIGHSYKRARNLQEHHYAIGLGECVFDETYPSEEDYSLIEYKYLHHFESLFRAQNWAQIYELLNKIKQNVISHCLSDSKSTYVYKEIFSITIRQSFEHLDTFKEEINALNEAINRFDHLFDDIHEVDRFYLSIFKKLTKINDVTYMHLYIKRALLIIEKRYMEPLTLRSLADQLNISVAYFSRLFKEEIGCGFKEYLTRFRMKLAREMLINSTNSIQDIALKVGYLSPVQFTRAFKQQEGMTPTDYRLNVRGGSL